MNTINSEATPNATVCSTFVQSMIILLVRSYTSKNPASPAQTKHDDAAVESGDKNKYYAAATYAILDISNGARDK